MILNTVLKRPVNGRVVEILDCENDLRDPVCFIQELPVLYLTLGGGAHKLMLISTGSFYKEILVGVDTKQPNAVIDC